MNENTVLKVVCFAFTDGGTKNTKKYPPENLNTQSTELMYSLVSLCMICFLKFPTVKDIQSQNQDQKEKKFVPFM